MRYIQFSCTEYLPKHLSNFTEQLGQRLVHIGQSITYTMWEPTKEQIKTIPEKTLIRIVKDYVETKARENKMPIALTMSYGTRDEKGMFWTGYPHGISPNSNRSIGTYLPEKGIWKTQEQLEKEFEINQERAYREHEIRSKHYGY